MKIKESNLRRALRRVILEFGEKDHELKQKLANRDKMIGRGIDMGTMPFNPNWDYDKKSYVSRKPKGFMSDEIKQVKSVIESNDMHGWLEAEATRNPDVIHLKSGDFIAKVENDYGLFKFSVVKPANWRGWTMECDSIDTEIDNVLYELSEYVDEKENS